MHLEDRHHVAELAVEPAKKGEHHLAVTNRITELGKRCSHGLQFAAVVGDRHGVLTEVAELSLKEKCMGLSVVDELTLKEPLGVVSV